MRPTKRGTIYITGIIMVFIIGSFIEAKAEDHLDITDMSRSPSGNYVDVEVVGNVRDFVECHGYDDQGTKIRTSSVELNGMGMVYLKDAKQRITEVACNYWKR